MTLPPFLREIQQSWAFHVVQAALFAAVPAAVTAYMDPSQRAAWMAVGATTFFTTLSASIQHSPGSASFKPDGSENKVVANVVAVQAAAADPAAPLVVKQAAVQTATAAAKAVATVQDATITK